MTPRQVHWLVWGFSGLMAAVLLGLLATVAFSVGRRDPHAGQRCARECTHMDAQWGVDGNGNMVLIGIFPSTHCVEWAPADAGRARR